MILCKIMRIMRVCFLGRPKGMWGPMFRRKTGRRINVIIILERAASKHLLLKLNGKTRHFSKEKRTLSFIGKTSKLKLFLISFAVANIFNSQTVFFQRCNKNRNINNIFYPSVQLRNGYEIIRRPVDDHLTEHLHCNSRPFQSSFSKDFSSSFPLRDR
jgi:hypothetical protein